MTTWLVQFLIAWASTPQTINAAFAALCLCAALGARPKPVALLSAALYLALVLI